MTFAMETLWSHWYARNALTLAVLALLVWMVLAMRRGET